MMRPFFAVLLVGLAAAPLTRANGKVDFSRDIQPLLSDNCFTCHGPDEKNRKARLRLDDEKNVKVEREVVVPGKSKESELYQRLIETNPKALMPPPSSNHKLTPKQINLIKRWIDEGAPWGEHWAFTKIVRPPTPALKKFANRVRNPLDAFILARLEKEGLAPSPPASPETLLRRLSLDLTGLPPTPEEVETFRKATLRNPQSAIEEAADRLLASPAFGERMAWDWLDAARYADSNGYQGDADRTMWPWRDWVVEAFNRNLPYDQFTIEQIAGDQLPSATLEQKLATAFLRNHMINGEGGRIPEENRVDYVMDMTETMGTVWLGLTLNCCRCHDHKYDPISQRDYYRLSDFFNRTPVDGGGGNPQTPPIIELATAQHKAELVKYDSKVRSAAESVGKFELMFFPRPQGKSAEQSEKAAKLPEAIKNILKSAPHNRGSNQLGQLEKQWAKEAPEYVKLLASLRSAQDARNNFNRSVPRVMVMEDLPKPRQTFILDKGLYNKRKDVVTAAVPAKLPSLPPGAPVNRLGLARWLVAPENPLTARVTVNRIWQQFFGIGLVKTTEDFGLQAEKPSHPELLDWLAAEFVARNVNKGWDLKHLIKLMVTSGTYQQASRFTPQLLERDPQNRLLARAPRFRMPSWMIRDQALAASGLLVRKLGGPPVNGYQPPGVWEEATFGKRIYKQDKGESLYRRSLYTFWRRIIGPTMFFDSAARQVCTVKQARTNTPLHALATLNDVTYVEAARALAERVLKAEQQPVQRLALAYRLVLARSPSSAEAKVLLAAVERVRGELSKHPEEAKKLLRVGESKRDERLDVIEHAAYASVCSAILNLDEALTKE